MVMMVLSVVVGHKWIMAGKMILKLIVMRIEENMKRNIWKKYSGKDKNYTIQKYDVVLLQFNWIFTDDVKQIEQLNKGQH